MGWCLRVTVLLRPGADRGREAPARLQRPQGRMGPDGLEAGQGGWKKPLRLQQASMQWTLWAVESIWPVEDRAEMSHSGVHSAGFCLHCCVQCGSLSLVLRVVWDLI